MNGKELTAWIQIIGGIAVLAWLAFKVAGEGFGTPATLATTLLWAIGAMIVINIVGIIVAAILVSIVRREELRDEPADERDDAHDARASRIGYAASGIVAAGALIPVALGADPVWAVAALFLAPLAGGLVHAVTLIALYRTR